MSGKFVFPSIPFIIVVWGEGMIEIIISNDTSSEFSWLEMTLQILVAVGTVGTAITALITTLQNKKTNSQLQTERHAMVKPSFVIVGYHENTNEKIIKFNVKNTGFDKTLSAIDCIWNGTAGVNVITRELFTSNDKHDLEITLDYNGCESFDIKGSMTLVYSDVLGKQYQESVIIDIYEHNNEVQESRTAILKDSFDRNFAKQ